MDSVRLKNQWMEKELGTSKPYFDVTRNWRSTIRGLVGPYNPFGHDQVSSADRLNATVHFGLKSYVPPPFPNEVHFYARENKHLDHEDYNLPEYHAGFGASPTPQSTGKLALTGDKIPKVCHRYLNIFKRCAIVNGNQKCGQEEKNFLSICPNFALTTLRDDKLMRQRMRQIQRNEYKEAMEISPYNVGRSVSEVDGNKRYADGTAKNLRPDSLWADDRYVDVTQKEIDEAKIRRANFLKTQTSSRDGNHGIRNDEHKAHDNHGHGAHSKHH